MSLKTIHKYVLSQAGYISAQTVRQEMPLNAEIIHIDMLKGAIALWALVDIHGIKETRWFEIIPTGYKFESEGLIHRGSVREQVDYTDYMWHVFERLTNAD